MVEMRTRIFGKESFDEIFINDVPVEMGEGKAELDSTICKIHGSQPALYGYNQGGHDGMCICLRCCKEIAEKFLED
jgi:hypothetical protein